MADHRGDEGRIGELVAALSVAEVEVYLEYSWCRICRTEGRGPYRGRDVHPHDPGCILARPADRRRSQHAPMLHPLKDWDEELGDVLFWRFPVNEPPYVGTPLDDEFPAYVTHFTLIPIPEYPANA